MLANPPPRLLTARDVAGLLRIHLVTVYSMAAEGRIPSVRIGRRRLFDPREISRLLETHAEPVREPLRPLGQAGSRRRARGGT